MNILINNTIRKFLMLSTTILLTQAGVFAQTTYTGNSVDLVVSGTSTLHDWDMKSANANCTAVFVFNTSNQPTGLNALSFSTPVSSLKSEHSSMDKNAYKALKNDKNPSVTYTMSKASINPGNAGTNTVKVTGHLTIAGATRDEEIIATCKANPDNSITVTGSKKISMKDYNMQPPTFMMGAVKTGNDIVLKFTVVLKKS